MQMASFSCVFTWRRRRERETEGDERRERKGEKEMEGEREGARGLALYQLVPASG